MRLSVICPVWNEQFHIGKIIEFFSKALPEDKELLIIDGGSTDDTVRIVQAWQAKNREIKLLHNPQRIVPYALNMAIPRCEGRYIVRLDAHTDYGEDYFVRILDCFARSGADIVGGPTRTKSTNAFQAAVAQAICTRFGIGDSRVHQEDYEGFTDSVTFGAWRREIFDRTGLFDTELVRNQDDEFHYRARSLGLRLYQDPAIRLYYYPRSTLRGLFRQYFEYGLYKPLVLRKVPSGRQWRHYIPSIFTLYMVTLHLWAWWSVWYLLPLGLYLLMNLYFSFRARLPLVSKMWSLLVYPAIHLGYGSGFILGLFKAVKK